MNFKKKLTWLSRVKHIFLFIISFGAHKTVGQLFKSIKRNEEKIRSNQANLNEIKEDHQNIEGRTIQINDSADSSINFDANYLKEEQKIIQDLLGQLYQTREEVINLWRNSSAIDQSYSKIVEDILELALELNVKCSIQGKSGALKVIGEALALRDMISSYFKLQNIELSFNTDIYEGKVPEYLISKPFELYASLIEREKNNIGGISEDTIIKLEDIFIFVTYETIDRHFQAILDADDSASEDELEMILHSMEQYTKLLTQNYPIPSSQSKVIFPILLGIVDQKKGVLSSCKPLTKQNLLTEMTRIIENEKQYLSEGSLEPLNLNMMVNNFTFNAQSCLEDISVNEAVRTFEEIKALLDNSTSIDPKVIEECQLKIGDIKKSFGVPLDFYYNDAPFLNQVELLETKVNGLSLDQAVEDIEYELPIQEIPLPKGVRNPHNRCFFISSLQFISSSQNMKNLFDPNRNVLSDAIHNKQERIEVQEIVFKMLGEMEECARENKTYKIKTKEIKKLYRLINTITNANAVQRFKDGSQADATELIDKLFTIVEYNRFPLVYREETSPIIPDLNAGERLDPNDPRIVDPKITHFELNEEGVIIPFTKYISEPPSYRLFGAEIGSLDHLIESGNQTDERDEYYCIIKKPNSETGEDEYYYYDDLIQDYKRSVDFEKTFENEMPPFLVFDAINTTFTRSGEIKAKAPSFNKDPEINFNGVRYRLVSTIVRPYGSVSGGGHYTSGVTRLSEGGQTKFYSCSDSSVREVGVNNSVFNDASMWYYEKVDDADS